MCFQGQIKLLSKTLSGLRCLKALGTMCMWLRFHMRTRNGSGVIAI